VTVATLSYRLFHCSSFHTSRTIYSWQYVISTSHSTLWPITDCSQLLYHNWK